MDIVGVARRVHPVKCLLHMHEGQGFYFHSPWKKYQGTACDWNPCLGRWKQESPWGLSDRQPSQMNTLRVQWDSATKTKMIRHWGDSVGSKQAKQWPSLMTWFPPHAIQWKKSTDCKFALYSRSVPWHTYGEKLQKTPKSSLRPPSHMHRHIHVHAPANTHMNKHITHTHWNIFLVAAHS